MKEIWKDIEGYEGLYQVSNLGQVKSLNYKRTGKEKILSLNKKKNGYLLASLCINKKQKKFLVHRLVANTFIPNPSDLPQVNHIDQNKLNNKVDNLEWCDNRYNTRYSRAKKVVCYKDNKLIKVYDALIDVDKDGFKYSSVCRCCNNIYGYKSHLGFQWKYLE